MINAKYSLTNMLAWVFLALLCVSIVAPSSLLAISENDYHAIHGNYVWYDPDAGKCGGSPGTGGSNIFIIGDSLTVGMRDSGELESKLKESGWNVLGIEATESITVEGSIEKLPESSSKISDSDTIVVALGTNKGTNFPEQLDKMIDELKQRSPDATIYWMNAHTGSANYDDVNNAIEEGSNKHGFNVIDWKTEFLADLAKYPWGPGDQIHHSALGYNAKSSFLVDSIGTATLGGSNYDGGSNPEKTFNFFRSKGLSPEQAAGITGNAMAESGADIDPTIVQPGGAYKGMFQWGTNGRWATLVNWANENGKDPLALETQLDYSWVESETVLLGMNAKQGVFIDELKSQDSVDLAAWYWGRYFEIAIIGGSTSETPLTNVQGLDHRIEYGKTVLEQFGGNAVLSSQGSCSNNTSISINGFWFPLETTKSVLLEGVDGTTWGCPESPTNCHHSNYNAADIIAPEGTIVVAATRGTIQMRREELGGGGSSVVVLGDDGNTYFYTHMKYNSLVAPEFGETIQGGDEIGQVGSASQATDTISHLHFDALPTDQYDHRPACASAACQGYPFIDMQPVLSELFKQLPE